MKKKVLTAGLLSLGMMGLTFADPNLSSPGGPNDDFNIQANVVKVCNIIEGASDVVLNYDPFETNYVTGVNKETTQVEFNCSKGTTYTWTVTFDGTLENTTDPNDVLNATVIPTTANSTDSNGTLFNEIITFTILIGTNQNPVAGATYQDTVDLTLSW
ncbi:hypothetical protein [Persephonella sp.]